MNSSESENLSNKSNLSDPNQWVKLHGDSLFGYALKFISDCSIAEDLVQETLLAALKGRNNYSGSSNERTWLIGILKNKVVDHYRKSGSITGREKEMADPEKFSDSDDNDFIASGPNAGSWNPKKRPKAWAIDTNDPVEKQQFWKQLLSCLDGIDQRLAMVYSLRDVHEMEYKEVCNVLEISSTNLRVMLYRARKLLRQCLETHWTSE